MVAYPVSQGTIQSHAGNNAAVPTILLGGLLFLPPVLPFLLNAPTFAVGTILCCLLAMGAYVSGLIVIRREQAFAEAIVLAGLVTAFMLAHLTINYLFRPVALVRAAQTLPLVAIFLATIPVVIAGFFERSDRSIDRAVVIVLGGYFASGLLSLVGVQPPGFYGEKPTFPFTEPSFFAFTIMPVIIYFCTTRSTIPRWIAVGALMGLAVAVSNLTSLAAGVLVLLTFARWWQIGLGMLLAYVAWPYVDQQYFVDRLTLRVDTVNLTSLVYVQGWQLLDESLRVTTGWGRGLQQLGAGYTNTIASYRINQIMGRDVNLFDGGFLLSKMGSEFGIFGLALIAALTGYAGLLLFRLRQFAHRKIALPNAVVFAYASVVGSMVEVFLRGSTYFTGTMLLLCSSLFYLRMTRVAQPGAQADRRDG